MPEIEADTFQTQAASAGVTFVEQLLISKRFTALQIAVFGARAFGVPLLDLAAFDLDQFQKEYFDAKISQQRSPPRLRSPKTRGCPSPIR